METKQSTKIRTVTGTAMLTAVAVGLQYIEISIPIMPSFIKLDFSDLQIKEEMKTAVKNFAMRAVFALS